MSQKSFLLVCLIISSSLSCTFCGWIDSYYYTQNELLEITVSKLNSVRTQIPFTYTYLELCELAQERHPSMGLKDVWSGYRKTYTNYNISINNETLCNWACEKDFNEADIAIYSWWIERHYFMDFELDSWPVGENYTNPEKNYSRVMYHSGIPVGVLRDEVFYWYNHYNIYVDLNEKNRKYQVVGFNIEPWSIKQNSTETCLDKDTNVYDKEMQVLEEGIITYTYNVYFRPSNITFSSRFDHWRNRSRGVHWLGLIASNIVIFIVSFLVIFILTRAIKRDIDLYNSSIATEEMPIDEYGWKQVCNDVFRRPKNLMLWSAMIGTGVELLWMIIQCLIFCVWGFWKPEARGGWINMMIAVFCFMGLLAGFVSNFIYKNNGGKDWIKCSLWTTLLFPALSFLVLFIVRIMFTFEGSSEGFQISEFLLLFVLWLCFSSPLVLIGSFLAVKGKNIKYPCKVNIVPTAIGDKPMYLKLKYITWLTGWIPFATIFIEFIYIMAAIWRHQVYFLASFVLFSVLFLVISSSEISIIFIYLNLCKGDYNWWWKSFIVSASPAIYFMLYSIYYFFDLNITRFSASVVYFTLMGFVSIAGGSSVEPVEHW